MTTLLKNALIIAAHSQHHNTRRDILIQNGKITKIASRISSDNAKVISSDDLHVSIGWMDVGTVGGEPGYEHRETLTTLTAAAASGGYTAIALFPNTLPVVDNKSSVQYIINSTKDHLVDYHPIGAISKAGAGEEITEMIDMKKAGAVAFSDGLKTVSRSGLMLMALQYAKTTDALIIHTPQDNSLSNGNTIHEGEVSTSLGLKGSPVMSESLTLDRDIQLLQYSDSKLLLHNLSSKSSVERVTENKDKKLFSSVSYLNLCLTEDAISNFDSNAKVNPPLRSEDDRQALTKAVSGGKIEIITSNHTPVEGDLKKMEFTYATPGAIGLQTCFSGIITHATKISVLKIVQCLTTNPRKILDIEIPNIEVDEVADLCIFDPSISWIFDDSTNLSKSKNSPFWNQKLKGKVIGVIKSKSSHFNNY